MKKLFKPDPDTGFPGAGRNIFSGTGQGILVPNPVMFAGSGDKVGA